MSLRNILYIDSKIVEDYISQIDGYIYEEESLTKNSSRELEGEIGVNFLKNGGKIQAGSNASDSSTKTVKITDASKLDKIMDYLSDDLKYYEKIDAKDWSKIKRNDFIEVLAKPRFSKVQEFIMAAKSIVPLADTVETFVEEGLMDEKFRKTLDGITKLENIYAKETTTCVFNFSDEKYPLIAEINERYLRIGKESFSGEVCMLCKIQKKVEENEKMQIDNIFEEINRIPLNRAQRRSRGNELSNPKEFKDEINGPALIVVPIAIYR